jgi:hypothetical protein
MNIPDLARLTVSTAAQTYARQPQQAEPAAPAQPNAAAEPAAEAVAKAPEVVAREQEQRIILSLYKAKFSAELEVMGDELSSKQLMAADLATLDLLREKCDALLGASSGCDNKKKMFNTCVYVLEKIACYSGVECTGLTAQLLSDAEYQKDITRLALKYLSAKDCTPEIVVPMKILSTIVQLHANAEVKRQGAQITDGLAGADEAQTEKLNKINAKYTPNIKQ